MRDRDVTVTHGPGEPGGREKLIPPGGEKREGPNHSAGF